MTGVRRTRLLMCVLLGVLGCASQERGREGSREVGLRTTSLIDLLDEGAGVVSEGRRPEVHRSLKLAGDSRGAIFQHPESTLRFRRLEAGAETYLEFAIGVRDAGWAQGGDGVDFEVLLGEGPNESLIFRRRLDPRRKIEDRGWQEHRVVIRPDGKAGAVDLILRTAGGPTGDAAFDWAAWAEPVLVSQVAARSRRPSVLLVSFDTLRADFVGAYGASPSPTPNLDRLAARGLTFEMAIAPGAWTRPSHFSLLTGLYPDVRTMRYDRQNCEIAGGVKTLAEALSERGYLTAAFTGGGFLSADLGFGQGFRTFRTEGRRFEDNLDGIIEWIETHGRSEFFLFVHHYNVHRPYEAPPESLRKFIRSTPRECDGQAFGRLDGDARRCLATPGGRAYLRGRYASAVNNADELFGRLLRALEEQGSLKDTVVIVTSDHGDELLERGSLDHVKSLYQEIVHVPLLMSGPGIPLGARAAMTVELIDVAPTVVELVDSEAVLETDGEALLKAGNTVNREKTFALAATTYDGTLDGLKDSPFEAQRAVVDRGWKLYERMGGDVGGELLLFDLERDPSEARDVGDMFGAETLALKSLLAEADRMFEVRNYCVPKGVGRELEGQLRALGYVQ